MLFVARLWAQQRDNARRGTPVDQSQQVPQGVQNILQGLSGVAGGKSRSRRRRRLQAARAQTPQKYQLISSPITLMKNSYFVPLVQSMNDILPLKIIMQNSLSV